MSVFRAESQSQWLCRGSGTQGPVAGRRVLQFWTQPLCWEQELVRISSCGPLVWCCSMPFDLATSSNEPVQGRLFPSRGLCARCGQVTPEAGSAFLDGLVTDACKPCLPWLSVGMAWVSVGVALGHSSQGTRPGLLPRPLCSSSSVFSSSLQQSARLKALADATPNTDRPLLKDFLPQPRRV